VDKPAKDVRHEWRVHPVTKYLLRDIQGTIDNIGDMFTQGSFVSDTEFETVKLHLKAVGAAEALALIYDEIDLVDSPEETSEDD